MFSKNADHPDFYGKYEGVDSALFGEGCGIHGSRLRVTYDDSGLLIEQRLPFTMPGTSPVRVKFDKEHLLVNGNELHLFSVSYNKPRCAHGVACFSRPGLTRSKTPQLRLTDTYSHAGLRGDLDPTSKARAFDEISAGCYSNSPDYLLAGLPEPITRQVELDLDQAHLIADQGSDEEKIELLGKISARLASAHTDICRLYMRIVSQLINDPHFDVEKAAVEALAGEEAPTSLAVDVIYDYLARHNHDSREVFNTAKQAARMLEGFAQDYVDELSIVQEIFEKDLGHCQKLPLHEVVWRIWEEDKILTPMEWFALRYVTLRPGHRAYTETDLSKLKQARNARFVPTNRSQPKSSSTSSLLT